MRAGHFAVSDANRKMGEHIDERAARIEVTRNGSPRKRRKASRISVRPGGPDGYRLPHRKRHLLNAGIHAAENIKKAIPERRWL